MRKIHDYLNAALSLHNIAELLQDSSVLKEKQTSLIREELELVLRFVERELKTYTLLTKGTDHGSETPATAGDANLRLRDTDPPVF